MGGTVRSMYMDIRERKTLDGKTYRVTIAANEKVRQPPELDFDGLSTENYVRNPVVMWAHDTVGHSPSGGLPIGRTLKLTKTSEGEVLADFEFLGDDAFAQRVKNAWDKGFLQAASISWIPIETVPIPGGGWRDAKSELLEWSIVSVPADPEALRESHRMLIDDFLGDRDWGLGVREIQQNGRGLASSPSGSQERTVLSPDDYDDLSTSLALLKDVMGGVEARGNTGSVTDDDQGDLSEIKAMVGVIKSIAQGTV